MIAAPIICAACWLASMAYIAYDSWSRGAIDGFEAQAPFNRAAMSRALYIAGYRIGAEARRIERLNRGER